MLIPFGILSAAGAGGEAGETYELIETTILSSAASSVTFSSLATYASTYKHLQIRAVARMSASSIGATGSFRLNGDTGANYAHHYLQGTGSAVQSAAGPTSDSEMENIYAMNAANDVSNGFTAAVIDILDAYSTTKNKTVRALSGNVGNESRIRLGSGVRLSTESLTSATMFSTNGVNFIAGSRFSLYGLR